MYYHDKPTSSDIISSSDVTFGHSQVKKSKMSMPVQAPVQKHATVMPHKHGRADGVNQPRQPDMVDKGMMQAGMHSHPGSPQAHPIRQRHRKGSADPLHKEEDTLMDEWHDLYDKAKEGMCTAQDLARIEQIRGRIDEISSSRTGDAEKILGIAMKALRKAEGTIEGFQVEDDDLADNTPDWQGREAEYGKPEIGNYSGEPNHSKVVPENEGYKDQVDRESGNIYPDDYEDDEVVHVAYPTETKEAPIKKAAQVTENVLKYFQQNWGHDTFAKDDGRFSDPLFYSKYADQIAKSIINKHDLPNSAHSDHMTNGGGWGVKLNPKTGNFVAYQKPEGSYSKREAQADAVRRNKAHKDEYDGNDKLMDALKPKDVNPLYRPPRMRP